MSIETALLLVCGGFGIAEIVFGAALWWKSRPKPGPDVTEIVKSAPYHVLQGAG